MAARTVAAAKPVLTAWMYSMSESRLRTMALSQLSDLYAADQSTQIPDAALALASLSFGDGRHIEPHGNALELVRHGRVALHHQRIVTWDNVLWRFGQAAQCVKP